MKQTNHVSQTTHIPGMMIPMPVTATQLTTTQDPLRSYCCWQEEEDVFICCVCRVSFWVKDNDCDIFSNKNNHRTSLRCLFVYTLYVPRTKVLLLLLLLTTTTTTTTTKAAVKQDPFGTMPSFCKLNWIIESCIFIRVMLWSFFSVVV